MAEIIKFLKYKRSWLITGVAGFIGSNLASFLLKNNQIVYGVDNFITGNKSNLNCLNNDKNFFFYNSNLTNLHLKIKKKINFCIHLAAINSVPRSFENPELVSANNINEFLSLILFLKKKKIKKLVYASSSSVYGNSKYNLKCEHHIPKPISPYAISKMANESHAEIYANKNLKMNCLRFFNVYGKKQSRDPNFSAVIPQWILQIKKNNTLNVFGNSVREFCYVDDAINAIILSAFKNFSKHHEIFNISGGKPIAIRKMVKIFKNTFGDTKTKIKYFKSREGDVAIARASLRKSKKMLGYKPLIDLKEGMTRIKQNDYD